MTRDAALKVMAGLKTSRGSTKALSSEIIRQRRRQATSVLRCPPPTNPGKVILVTIKGLTQER
jgi:hypothetical protein